MASAVQSVLRRHGDEASTSGNNATCRPPPLEVLVMARRPDAQCSGCGKPLWGGTTSLPPGQRTCRDCRRIKPRPYSHRSNGGGVAGWLGQPPLTWPEPKKKRRESHERRGKK